MKRFIIMFPFIIPFDIACLLLLTIVTIIGSIRDKKKQEGRKQAQDIRMGLLLLTGEDIIP